MLVARNNKRTRRSFSFFDPHHVIERQTVYIGLSIGLLAGGMTVSQIHYNHVRYEQLMKVDQAGATSNFSKTNNTTLTLGKTHLSTDNKTAFIPITFSSTDNVGIKANNYRFYVLAASGKAMQYKVSGHFIMYGTTGRGVLVLHSPTKIENQPLVLFVINQKKVSTVDEQNEDDTMDTTDTNSREFGKYDIAPFKINPGATDVHSHSKIDETMNNPEGVYESLFGSSDIQEIRKNIRSDQRRIKKQEAAASALRERLQDAGYEVPANPDWVKDSWRPDDAINLQTGKTANGKSALTYQASSQESGQDTFPTSLKNKDGSTTSDAQANSQSDDDNANGDSSQAGADSSSNNANQIGGTASDPATQWSKLQQAWTNIKQAKRDLYVVQYQRLYKIRHKSRNILSQATVGAGKNVVQKGKVEVAKDGK